MKKLDIKVIYRDRTTEELKDDPIYRITDPSIGIKIKREEDDKYQYGWQIVCSDGDVRPVIGEYLKETMSIYFEFEKRCQIYCIFFLLFDFQLFTFNFSLLFSPKRHDRIQSGSRARR